MFKKLRNRLILINLGVTSIVIVVVFSAIYIASTRSAETRAPMFNGGVPAEMLDLDGDGMPDGIGGFIDTDGNGVPDYMENIVIGMVREEKKAAASSLLITLLVSGAIIEITVALISYFLAEEAIKPVREAYEAQKIFIANASHEIKTPLAAIAANLEAADLHHNKWIRNVETETAKLTALNSSLLTLARTDLTTTQTIADVDMAELVREVARSFEPRIAPRVKFKINIASSRHYKVNADDLKQILGILMDNAIKYCDRKISLVLDDRTITVENDGATIDKTALPHVFERFYQADKSADGVGLGLSIAKSLSERNGWSLSVTSSHHLTRFCLKF